MTQLLKAKPYMDARLIELRAMCDKIIQKGHHPKLDVVLVGNNPASQSYVSHKEKFCREVGAKFELHRLPADVPSSVFLKTLEKINQDPLTHGCIIQLPVYGESTKLPLDELVIPSKDVDCFHPLNTAKLYQGRIDEQSLLPCTPKGVMSLLRYYGINPKGMNAVVIGRSQIVGKPMSLLLNLAGATVTMCHSQTRDIKAFTRQADLVVTAVGKEKFLNVEYFDKTRHTTVIDVGINKNAEGKLVGDVDFSSVEPLVKAITPVPGGVGPMTVISLVENVLIACKNQGKIL